ncbi:MAG: hypothetical protein WCJ72_09950 [Chryseobacterium sp.]|jgi:hypothetical protein
MATPSIGTYTEKKISTQISILLNQIDELESLIKNPPFIVFHNMMDIPSEFSNDWRAQITHILSINNINPNWILNKINPHSKTEYPYFVTIQFISHCIKETVFTILSKYLNTNDFDNVYITKDTL